MSKWEVWYATDSGQRIKPLGPVLREMNLTLVTNGVGYGQFSFPLGTIALNDLSVDQQLQVYYSPDDDGTLTLIRVFFIRHWLLQRTATGDGELRLSGPDQNDLLVRRIIPFPAAGKGQRGATADNMMKAIVRENLASLVVDTDRDIRSYGFSVESDSGDGLNITKAFPYTNLMEALQAISLASRGNNRVNGTSATDTYFDVVVSAVAVDGTPSFEFRTFVQQPGQDRRESTGDAPAIFSEVRGNLTRPMYERDHTDEANYIYVGLRSSRDNLVANAGFEDDTSGWSTGGTNTLSTSPTQEYTGSQSARITYKDSTDLLILDDITLPQDISEMTVTAWVYVPSSWDGGDIRIEANNLTGASSTYTDTWESGTDPNDEWYQIESSIGVVAASDIIGGFKIVATSAPSVNELIYVDAVRATEERSIREVSWPDGISESQWNRREFFVNAPAETSGAADNRGYEFIERRRPSEAFSGELLNTPQSRWPYDWNIGDYVTVRAFGRTFDDIIRDLRIRVRQGSGTEIIGDFEHGALLGSVQRGMLKEMARLKRRIEILESEQ